MMEQELEQAFQEGDSFLKEMQIRLSEEQILKQQQVYERMMYDVKERQMKTDNFKPAMQRLIEEYDSALNIEKKLIEKVQIMQEYMLQKVNYIKTGQKKNETDKQIVENIIKEKEKIYKLIQISKKREEVNKQTVQNLKIEVMKLQEEIQYQMKKENNKLGEMGYPTREQLEKMEKQQNECQSNTEINENSSLQDSLLDNMSRDQDVDLNNYFNE